MVKDAMAQENAMFTITIVPLIVDVFLTGKKKISLKISTEDQVDIE